MVEAMRYSLLLCMVAALLAANLTAGPAWASDFSRLAEPSFARFLLLPAKRQRHLECAGLAQHRAKSGLAPGKTAADRLAAAVSQRLAIELDDPKLGQEMIEGKASGHSDPTKTESFWEDVRQMQAEQCAALFEAAGKGERQLTAELGPVPPGPLQLPSLDQCLAVASRAEETGQDDGLAETASALRKVRIDQASPPERASREAAVAGGLAILRAMSVDGEQLQMMSMACIPTMVEAAKDLPPEAWKPLGN